MRAPLRRLALLSALVLASACGDTGLLGVEPRLATDKDAIDFGQRPVLDDLAVTMRLSNLGRGPMELAIRIEGDAAFTLLDTVTALEGGAEADLRVNFVATEMKAYTAKLVIDTNETENAHHEYPLTGEGSTVAGALIEPASLDFGRVGEGRTAVRRVKITSTGTAELKIKTIAFKEGTSAAFGFVGSTRTPQLLDARKAGQDDSFAEISVKFSPTPGVAETAGTLVLETTDPDHAIVEVPLAAAINRPPVADPGLDRQVAPGTTVQLDGSASTDPDGDLPLTFKWTLASQPQGSAASLVGGDTANPSLLLDQPGGYGVDLVVTDSAGLASKPKRLNLTGVAADKLIIELIWDHPVADLDLHVLRPGDVLFTPNDCSWEHPNPDWGTAGDPNDDPFHLGDKLSGFGPERVVYEEPPDGSYRVVAKYVSAQGSDSPALNATIRVRMYGVIVSEATHAMNASGEVWEAGTVAWPSGNLTPTPPPGGTP